MTAIVLAAPAVEIQSADRRRYAPQILLALGWIGLFGYCATYLTEDLPFRSAATPAVEEPLLDPPEDLPRRALAMMRSEEPASAAAAPASALTVEAASAPAATGLAVQPVLPATAPRPAAEYIGTWGPTAEACGAPSRRRGYLPATITPERARAGDTVCSFRDTHRSGTTWTMAADCADRDRRWSSHVRLVVDGDRLTWTSAWGTAAYIRCGRRAG